MLDIGSFCEGMHATSLHPGNILTNLLRHVDMSGIKLNGDAKKTLKSPEQGAATTVWAAIGKEWEGKGGKYLEECSIAQPVDPTRTDLTPSDSGYKAYAYDEEAAKRLWNLSNQMVGLPEE